MYIAYGVSNTATCNDRSWHRDKPPADCWPLPNYRVVKAIVNFWDVAANGGPTAVVPGRYVLSPTDQSRSPCTFCLVYICL